MNLLLRRLVLSLAVLGGVLALAAELGSSLSEREAKEAGERGREALDSGNDFVRIDEVGSALELALAHLGERAHLADELLGVDLAALGGDPRLNLIGRNAGLLRNVLNLLDDVVEVLGVGCNGSGISKYSAVQQEAGDKVLTLLERLDKVVKRGLLVLVDLGGLVVELLSRALELLERVAALSLDLLGDGRPVTRGERYGERAGGGDRLLDVADGALPLVADVLLDVGEEALR